MCCLCGGALCAAPWRLGSSFFGRALLTLLLLLLAEAPPPMPSSARLLLNLLERAVDGGALAKGGARRAGRVAIGRDVAAILAPQLLELVE